MSGAICAHLSLKNWVQSQSNPPKMTQKVTFSYFSILEFWVIFNLQLCLTRCNLLFLTNFQHIRPRKMTQRWKMVKKVNFWSFLVGSADFGANFLSSLHYYRYSEPQACHRRCNFWFLNQSLAYETQKRWPTDQKQWKNDFFGHFLGRLAIFWPFMSFYFFITLL